jgi:hypothetical protein
MGHDGFVQQERLVHPPTGPRIQIHHINKGTGGNTCEIMSQTPIEKSKSTLQTKYCRREGRKENVEEF